ncbi:hypothetical protein RYH80_03885 [Halobaculum sp. MBLA0147]|uniref:hypothetical protein n=1 Tax=Halobaculum sp. MBLA0147 TaxID=3079934 RepID=UPI00352357A1
MTTTIPVTGPDDDRPRRTERHHEPTTRVDSIRSAGRERDEPVTLDVPFVALGDGESPLYDIGRVVYYGVKALDAAREVGEYAGEVLRAIRRLWQWVR